MADPDFARYLEVRMTELKVGVEELLEMHDRYGDTLQKSYLYKARRALIDGLGWFEWSRKRAVEKPRVPNTFPAHICRHGEPERTCPQCFPEPQTSSHEG